MRRLYFFRGGQILPFVLFFLFFSLSKSQKLAGNVSNPFISYIFSFFFPFQISKIRWKWLYKSQKFAGNGFPNLKNSLDQIRFNSVFSHANTVNIVSIDYQIRFNSGFSHSNTVNVVSIDYQIRFNSGFSQSNTVNIVSIDYQIRFNGVFSHPIPEQPRGTRGLGGFSKSSYTVHMCVWGGGVNSTY